jgi:hypothetical protein
VDADPYVFESPGSGSVIICTDPPIRVLPSTSKKRKKTLIYTILWLLTFYSLKTDKTVPSKSKKIVSYWRKSRLWIRSWIRIRIWIWIRIRKSVVRIQIRTKMSCIHNTRRNNLVKLQIYCISTPGRICSNFTWATPHTTSQNRTSET